MGRETPHLTRIRGAISALVTPFRNGKIDRKGFKGVLEYQLARGVEGFVPCGTTGESATLTYEEHEEVIELALEITAGRIPVVAGTGSNSTHEAIRFTKFAEKAKADAALVVTPYYNKPTQEGLFAHFKAVSEAVSIPIILYNIPGRSGVNMLPETVARLSERSNVVGIKEASGNVRQVSDILALCGPEFIVLSGEDPLNFPIFCLGAVGSISVLSNILPQEVSEMCRNVQTGQLDLARHAHQRLLPLCDALFSETNPIGIKAALSLMGMISNELRLPLTPMRPHHRDRLRNVMQSMKILRGKAAGSAHR